MSVLRLTGTSCPFVHIDGRATLADTAPMHDLDICLLRTFLTLVETKNFTRTAKKIGRTQSATSMQIARLEEILGCRLFVRDKRNIHPTPDGEKLLGYARQLVELNDAMIHRFREPDVKGSVRFGSPEDFATFYLPGILAQFTQHHPLVGLNVQCDLTLSLIRDFDKNKYDLIIIKQEPGHLHPGAQPLWRERLVWAGGNRAEKSTRFSTLIRSRGTLPLVLSPPPCVYRQRALDALDHAGVRWKTTYTSPSIAGTTAAVKAGLGYTILPRNMLPTDLVPLETEHGWPKLHDAEMCLLSRPDGNSATKALAEFIREHVDYNQHF
jgi:DNA-binding transcriptional LysR family regulator